MCPRVSRRVPPHNPESEMALIGCAILEPERLRSLSIKLPDPEMFFHPLHRQIWSHLCTLYQEGKPIDIGLASDYPAPGTQKDRMAYLSQCIDAVTVTMHADYYAERVDYMHRCRTLGSLTEQAAEAALKGDLTGAHSFIDLMAAQRFRPNGIVLSWADMPEVEQTEGWMGWLAPGQAHMILAAPGVGKSQVMMYIAGCFTNGFAWPDGSLNSAPRGNVLWLESENGQYGNRDRARALGIDPACILSPVGFDQSFSLEDPQHLASADYAASRDDVKVVFLDSYSSAQPMRDENKAEAKRGAEWLATLARRIMKPVLVTHHPRKLAPGEDWMLTLKHARGNSGICQSFRNVWALSDPGPDPPDRPKVLHVIKTNYGATPPPIGCIVGKGVLFDPHYSFRDHRPLTEAERARPVVFELLRDKPLTYSELEAQAAQQAISPATLRKLVKPLGIVVIKRKGDTEAVWALPPDQKS